MTISTIILKVSVQPLLEKIFFFYIKRECYLIQYIGSLQKTIVKWLVLYLHWYEWSNQSGRLKKLKTHQVNIKTPFFQKKCKLNIFFHCHDMMKNFSYLHNDTIMIMNSRLTVGKDNYCDMGFLFIGYSSYPGLMDIN